MLTFDADMPAHRAKVMFRGQSKPCFVLSADKLASDQKNFREAAGMLRGGSPRANMLAAWLETLAEEYA